MLAWKGDRNFYNQLDQFWFIEGSQESLNFEGWLSVWGPAQEVGAVNGPIPWTIPEWTLAVALSEVTAAEFALDPKSTGLAATDGSRAGTDSTRLPEFYKVPLETAPEKPAEPEVGEETSRDESDS